jgi:hypothetical protein
MKRLLVVAALLSAACGSQKPVENPLPPGYVTVGTFTGEVDTEAGTFTVTSDEGTGPRARTQAVVPESATTVTIANTGALVGTDVWNNAVSPTGACGGALVTGAKVIVTQKYGTPTFLGAVYAEITSVSATGVTACNSTTAPTGLTAATGGLWSYRDLTWAGGARNPNSNTVEWDFLTSSASRFTFSGRIVAFQGKVTTTAITPSAGYPQWGDTGTQMVFSPYTANLQFVAYDGTLGSPTGSTSGIVTSLIIDANRIWFVTIGNTAYAGYMTKDGASISTYQADTSNSPIFDSIRRDPAVDTRAWILSMQYSYFRSFDIGGGLGTKRAVCSNPQDMVFGTNGNLFVVCSGTIQEYATDGTLQNTFTPPTSPATLCNAPRHIINIGGTFWFTAGTPGSICTMVPNPGTPNTNAADFIQIATSPNPVGLGVGPDGHVWAADVSNRALVRAIPGDPAYSISLPAASGNLRNFGVSSGVLWATVPNGIYRMAQ